LLGVSAMAVQSALVLVSLKGAPSTGVMTTNIARFIMDVGEVAFGREAAEVAKARSQAKRTWPAILGHSGAHYNAAAAALANGRTSEFLHQQLR
jgi:uncharacterized membrane protein YoaK (UPF0700 family)